ncbi:MULTISPECIES: Mph(E)/Mph(G) family macrolide 2'-phosphotransferase [Gammaproteobacteria]|uniref:Mph(E)/Mph(G) family macrolide 2'-phosphotransferase n=3 Tax=Gammaproteobacteria TaxID=1236 RepID=A0AAW7DUR3_9GAMM|nr:MULTISPECIES: Mph(E)/Mph(G) family macrolide 2'-phosphotransferase [Gammaproteobacteria]EMC2277037.1 Mph(E)/Mph(G) family macrolide 2'-phosphotransferase [Escherichia coli]AXN76451.1 Aldehyde dehydrogenase [Proteus mirabilis]EMC2277220.1 Mph(E)/Mph(G) family macrolide 2'-phosphotransferase [Escherichia coli]MCI9769148.1 Mph(E)/Mph(G) family macrolide 2'-phosphotransferase [Proteus mirabilis]MCI9772742.1 Mph(E)/Mph(G) family macrolide 2'-phosphotransferase [Proteus mirabilis]
MKIKDIQKLAETHGLLLTDEMKFNEMGIDFKVGFATDTLGKSWLLRLPRRSDLGTQIETEKRILKLVQKYLSVQVPDWKIATPELIAYPLLDGNPALTFDAQTYEVTWNMEQDSPLYTPSLARILVELHRIPEQEVIANELKVVKPENLRTEIQDRLQLVKSELGISTALENRYRKWLDNDSLWPDFTRFIHGDLYAGHVLTSKVGNVSGIIDWSTAQVSDIAQDFSGHAAIFGEESLKVLIAEYEKQGGKIWDTLFEQTLERAAAAPLAYGFFAVETQDEVHIKGAKAQLGVE